MSVQLTLKITIGTLATMLAASPPVGADPKADVDALVRRQIASLDAPTVEATFTADAIILASELGTKPPSRKPWEVYKRVFRNLMVGVDAKVDELAVTVTDKAAWFHGTVAITINDSFGPRKEARVMRISGIAIDNGGWKIAAEVFSMAVDDKTLFADAKKFGVKPTTGAPMVTGDAGLGAIVAGWFAKPQLGKTASTTAAVVANGTAPAEYQTGVAAIKLAASWDALKLRVTTVDARVHGALGFVTVTATLTIKGQKLGARLVLGAIVAKDGAGWRWLSLDWAVPNWDTPSWPHDAETSGSPD